jgi:hypothetical protein
MSIGPVPIFSRRRSTEEESVDGTGGRDRGSSVVAGLTTDLVPSNVDGPNTDPAATAAVMP